MSAHSPDHGEHKSGPVWLDRLVMFSPVVVLAAMQIMWLIAPEFYLRSVLEEQAREQGVVEIVTFACAALAAVMLAWSAMRCWRGKADRLGAVQVAVVAVAALFFAGEEISWGQTYLGWETPEEMREITGHNETNVHNIEIEIPLPFAVGAERVWRPSVQSLGSLFIICTFIVFPLLWLRQKHPRLPRSLACAVPEWPVVSCCVVAFAWKGYKDLYKFLVDDYESHAYYMQFVEQINEHKEMLIALTLFWYGVYRFRASRGVQRVSG